MNNDSLPCANCGYRGDVSRSKSNGVCPQCGYLDDETEVLAVGRVISTANTPVGSATSTAEPAVREKSFSRKRLISIVLVGAGTLLLTVGGLTCFWPRHSDTLVDEPSRSDATALPDTTPFIEPVVSAVVPPPLTSERQPLPMAPFTVSEPPPAKTLAPAVAPAKKSTEPAPVKKSAANDWYHELAGVRFYSDERLQLNGVLPPVSHWGSGPWVALLPVGKHVVKRDKQSTKVEPTQTFTAYYQKVTRNWRLTDGTWNFDLLLAATKGCQAQFHEPVLPHAWGNYYWQQKDEQAARRFWNLAIRLEPSFAPAHLNLAFLHLTNRDSDNAWRELALVRDCNHNNSYGLAEHLLALQERAGFDKRWELPARFEAKDYFPPQELLTAEEQQVVAFYENFAAFATSPESKARALHNAGVYLLRVPGKPQAATLHFSRALLLISEGSTDELRRLILQQLVAGTRQAKFAEEALYQYLLESDT